MKYFNFEKKHCPLCGHLLERYPNNGAPLINEEVCLDCNNRIILPYRYFLATYKVNSNAMLIRDGRIKLIKTSDDTFKLSDIELYLGKKIAFEHNAKLGLTFAFVKGMEEEPYDLNKVAQKALKAPNFKSVMVIPTRLLKGVKFNE
jgi:hypothetical protein